MTSATDWIERAKAKFGAGQADLGQAGADRRLAGDEGGAAGGAALLAVPVGEDRAFSADAVDVGRAVAHDPHVVGADIEPADVVAHDEQDVRLAPSRCRLCLREREWRACADCGRRGERRAAEQNISTVGEWGGLLSFGILLHHSLSLLPKVT